MCEWIRCSDRLPERSQEVLIYWGNFKVIDAIYNNGLFYTPDTNFIIDTVNVTHWMPRPILEPPKE